MKTNAKKVTKVELIESLPVDNWFSSDVQGLIVSKDSFRQHIRKCPEAYVERKFKGARMFYKIKSASRLALIEFLSPQEETRKKQRIKPRKLTKEDKLLNLFMLA